MYASGKILLVIAFVLLSQNVLAQSYMQELKNVIKDLCKASSERGKYWNLRVSADGSASVRLKLADLGLSGDATFSREEWEGIQQVMKEDQLKDNERYTECVVKITPIFVERFSPPVLYRREERDRSFSFNERNNHCDDDREFNIRVNADNGWEIDVSSVNPSIETSSRSSFSGIRDSSAGGFAVKGYVRNNGICVWPAHDARGHVWGTITYKEFRNTK